jgi:hypothetical protein
MLQGEVPQVPHPMTSMNFFSLPKPSDIIAKFTKPHEKRLQDHINIEASRLLNVNNITRRLKRKKPFELVRR